MNTNSSNNSLLAKSLISFVILVIFGAIVYMYFNAFVLNSPQDSAEIKKTQEEIDREKRLAEMTAPPRQDIELSEKRSAEIQSDLRAKPESTNDNESARSQLTN